MRKSRGINNLWLPIENSQPLNGCKTSNLEEMKAHRVLAVFLLTLFLTPVLHAGGARFDLVGPRIEVRVTREGMTLPVAEVPDLQPGDRLWVKADLPRTQSNHLLLVIAFLRGTTNVPPGKWFTAIDTWDRKAVVEGTTVVVPEGAEQALLFIAPKTGGDFKTLRSAVRGNPGTFIRADADLNEASFEEQRIQRYLSAMQSVTDADAKTIQKRSARLAATLDLRPDAGCFQQPVEDQVACLTQSSAPVILNDGHGQGIAEVLSGGPSSNFINSASTTQAAGDGYYSAYVGTVVDLIALIGSLHTAQYQYIPGLSFPQGDTLNLKLNSPPSFHNPMSVIVVGLPAIQSAKFPPLRPPNPGEVVCLLRPRLVLPLQGAPLVFSTGFAHDMVLHLNRSAGITDIPIEPDAGAGGLVAARKEQRRPLLLLPLPPAPPAPNAANSSAPGSSLASASALTLTGTVRGYWGFQPFQGPTLTVQQIAGKGWKILGDTQLLAGAENHLALRGEGAGCIQEINLTGGGKAAKVSFVPQPGPDQDDAEDKLALTVSLKNVPPGSYSLAIQQYGDPRPVELPLTAYTNGITLSGLKIHSGDDTAILTGKGLENVAFVELDKHRFTPEADALSGAGGPHAAGDGDLPLKTNSGVSPSLGSYAAVRLTDGRTMDVAVEILAPRPSLKLVYFHAAAAQPAQGIPVTLSDQDDIPLDGTLTFVVQTKEDFPRSEIIEVATADGALQTELSLKDNSMVLQDEHTAVATLDLLKSFGRSAFGKLRIRAVAADGTNGDWITLGNLVRRPHITAIHCTTLADPTCTLEGDDLYLAQFFSAARDFSHPEEVPIGFAASSFSVPTPLDGKTLYFKLRDNPTDVATLTLPTPIPMPAPPPPAVLPTASGTGAGTGATAVPSALPAAVAAAAAQPSSSAGQPSPPLTSSRSASTSAAGQPATSPAVEPVVKSSGPEPLLSGNQPARMAPVSEPVNKSAPAPSTQTATPTAPAAAPSPSQKPTPAASPQASPPTAAGAQPLPGQPGSE